MFNNAFVTSYFHCQNVFPATMIVVMIVWKLPIGAHVERMSVSISLVTIIMIKHKQMVDPFSCCTYSLFSFLTVMSYWPIVVSVRFSMGFAGPNLHCVRILGSEHFSYKRCGLTHYPCV